MQTFAIHESNLERLEKKLATIQKKCIKNQVEFTYRQVGEEFRDVKDADGQEYTARYVLVEVEGSVKHAGWAFVGTIDHREAGNVIRTISSKYEVPKKYETCGPTCEHCNKIRSRKDTYLVYNEESHEFKQVGKSCLTEYTSGLDAEEVAWFVQIYDALEAGSSYGGSSYTRWIKLEPVLRYAFECVKHFGYEKSSEDEWGTIPRRTTRQRVSDYKAVIERRTAYYPQRKIDELQAEMDEVGFNPESSYAVETAQAARAWILAQEPDNQYLKNLKVICAEDYIQPRDFGFVVSLPAAYNRYLANEEYKEKVAKQREAESVSEFQGAVGDRLTIQVASATCVTSFESAFGTTWLYKFSDSNDNIYIWYASKCIDQDEISTLVGTVKDHSVYNGVKQTVLTRCKAS